MLDEFVSVNRTEIIRRCRAKVAARSDPAPGAEIPTQPLFSKRAAASMGVPAERANDRDAIGAAIERALEREGPSLIEIPIR